MGPADNLVIRVVTVAGEPGRAQFILILTIQDI